MPDWESVVIPASLSLLTLTYLDLLFIACCAAAEQIRVCIYMLGELKWLGQVHVVMSNRVCWKPKNSFSFHWTPLIIGESLCVQGSNILACDSVVENFTI